MKKKFSMLHIFMLILFINSDSLQSSQGELMDSSLISIPTKRGLGLSYFFADKMYGETSNTLLMLKQKEFDPDNQSCYNKLTKAITDVCTENQDLSKAIQIVSLINNINTEACIQNSKKINLRDSNFFNLHYFLDTEKNKKLDSLKSTIENDNDEYITQFNIKLNDIKQSLCDQIQQLKTIHTKYVSKRNEHIANNAIEIKSIKNSLVTLHKINPKQTVFKFYKRDFEDPYCSDDEKDENDVEKTYSNDKIIKNINAKSSLETIDKATQEKIIFINRLFETFNKIQPLK